MTEDLSMSSTSGWLVCSKNEEFETSEETILGFESQRCFSSYSLLLCFVPQRALQAEAAIPFYFFTAVKNTIPPHPLLTHHTHLPIAFDPSPTLSFAPNSTLVACAADIKPSRCNRNQQDPSLLSSSSDIPPAPHLHLTASLKYLS